MRYILTLLFIQLAGLTTSVLAQQLEGHVTLANGDRIPATIQSFDDKKIEFGSPLFTETATVQSDFLNSLGFLNQSPETENIPSDQFDVIMRSGNRLSGELISLDNETCKIVSPFLGTIKIPRGNIVEISRKQHEHLLARFSATNWQLLSKTYTVSNNGSLTIQRKAKRTGVDNSLTLPQKLGKDTNIQIEFLSDEKTEFTVFLRHSGNNDLATIGVTPGNLLVDSKNSLEFGEFLSFNGNSRLSINHTGDKAIQILNELGCAVATIPWESETPLSVVIQNETDVLQLREIKVFSKSKPVEQADLTYDLPIVWGPTETQPAKSVTVKGGLVTATSALPSADSAPIKWQLHDVDRIWLGSDSADALKTNAKKFVCHWLNGDVLGFDRLTLADGKLEYQTDEFESNSSIETMYPVEILLSNTRAKDLPKQSSKSLFRLAISGIPFSGTYSWGDAAYPVRWQFRGFSAPVTLDIKNRKIEIKRVGSTNNSTSGAASDLIFLKDGSILPCKITTSSNENLNMECDRVSPSSVPLNQVGSFFFASRHHRWRKKLTGETIQKALTKPRFLHDDGFEHVLIGKNGDLLRGILVSVGEDYVDFESRYQVIRIDKENVAGVVALEPLEDAPENSDENRGLVAHIECGNDFVAAGKYISLDDGGAIIKSEVLGRLRVNASNIRRVAFNSPLDNVHDLQEFTKWKPSSAIDPRWKEKSEKAANAYELKDKLAPDFETSMLDDSRNFRLADHAGKIVVVYFWDSTSRPSVLGLPEYMAAIEKFSPRDVEFIALNQGETKSVVSQFIESKKLNPLKIAIDYNSSVSNTHKVTGIPHLTVIDREGIVRWIRVGYSKSSAAELESKILELIQ